MWGNRGDGVKVNVATLAWQVNTYKKKIQKRNKKNQYNVERTVADCERLKFLQRCAINYDQIWGKLY